MTLGAGIAVAGVALAWSGVFAACILMGWWPLALLWWALSGPPAAELIRDLVMYC